MYSYYAIIDTTDYLADQLFVKNEVRVWFGQEYICPDGPYCVIFCKCRKRDMDEYDTIFVEFPIWWYIAPTIVNAFLESYDLTGKTIIPFATSGGSGMGKTNEALKPSCTGATLLEGKVWKSTAKKEELSVWADSLACR